MSRWIVKIDETRHNKRFVSIEDTEAKKRYSNYFPLRTSDIAVIQRFKRHVKENRAILAKGQSNINLNNFEAQL